MSNADPGEPTPSRPQPDRGDHDGARGDNGGDRRRRRSNVLVVVVVLAVLATGWATLNLTRPEPERATVAVDSETPIQGVQEYSDQSQDHVETPVDYPQAPPVGGDHLPVWQNCGFYATPIQDGAGVHSLEHGAVWLGYDPDLPAAQVQQLQGLAEVSPYLLVSPVEDLAAPLVASAWGIQLALDGIDDDRLPVFLVKYLQGEQTPEPGAPCSGGLS